MIKCTKCGTINEDDIKSFWQELKNYKIIYYE